MTAPRRIVSSIRPGGKESPGPHLFSGAWNRKKQAEAGEEARLRAATSPPPRSRPPRAT